MIWILLPAAQGPLCTQTTKRGLREGEGTLTCPALSDTALIKGIPWSRSISSHLLLYHTYHIFINFVWFEYKMDKTAENSKPKVWAVIDPFHGLTNWLPSRVEVSERVWHVAGHARHNGPFTAQVFDHDGRQEHGGDDDGGVDDTQRRHAHPVLCIQTALHKQGRASCKSSLLFWS